MENLISFESEYGTILIEASDSAREPRRKFSNDDGTSASRAEIKFEDSKARFSLLFSNIAKGFFKLFYFENA